MKIFFVSISGFAFVVLGFVSLYSALTPALTVASLIPPYVGVSCYTTPNMDNNIQPCLDRFIIDIAKRLEQLEARIAKLEAANSGLTIVPGLTIPGELTPVTVTTLDIGDKGNQVKIIQEFLKVEGSFDYPTATGYFGQITRDAITNFQEKNSLSVSGVVDQPTLKKMETRASQIAPSLMINIQQMIKK